MAIAFDAASGTVGGVPDLSTSMSWSHTFSGANRVVWIWVCDRNGGLVVSSITVGGTAATQLLNGTRGEMWRLVAPATGSQTISVTLSTATAGVGFGLSLSLNDVDQTTPEDTTSLITEPATGTSISHSITTVTANAWILDGVLHRGGTTLTAGGSQTKRVEDSVASPTTVAAMSTRPVATPASTAMDWTGTASSNWAHGRVVARPAAAPVSMPPQPLMNRSMLMNL